MESTYSVVYWKNLWKLQSATDFNSIWPQVFRKGCTLCGIFIGKIVATLVKQDKHLKWLLINIGRKFCCWAEFLNRVVWLDLVIKLCPNAWKHWVFLWIESNVGSNFISEMLKKIKKVPQYFCVSFIMNQCNGFLSIWT